MGKRSEFDKIDKDKYYTIDPRSIDRMGPWFDKVKYVEPCAGDGSLVRLMKQLYPDSHAVLAFDQYPEGDLDHPCYVFNALDLKLEHIPHEVDCIITNPPFSWNKLKPLLDHLPGLLPTWFLLPADLMHNKRMGPYMKKCKSVVSVGRLYWFTDDDGNFSRGYDNYAWFLFTHTWFGKYARFYGQW